MRVLVIEDNPKMSVAIQKGLKEQGFATDVSGTGFEGEDLACSNVYDLIVLDLMLPDRDGIEVCRNMRRRGVKSKVLMLTALSSTDDKVTGLNAGADDYLAKPFDLSELQARLNALLRRSRGDDDTTCGNLRFDRRSGVFYNDFRPLELSPREKELLNALLRSRGQVVTREALRDQLFGKDNEASADAIEVLVHRLRKRIAGSSAEIMTLRGVGYLLIDEAIAGKED
jgi:two-component system response regulator TctD